MVEAQRTDARNEAAMVSVLLDAASNGTTYLLSGNLNDRSKALVLPGLRAFINMIGASVSTRVVVDPRVIVVCVCLRV